MNNLEFEGKIIKVFPPKKVGEYIINEFVVMDTSKYPQSAKFQLFNKPDIMDYVKVGNKVKVKFNLKGREYNENYFTNLDAWAVNVIGNENKTEETAPVTNDLPEEDLPF